MVTSAIRSKTLMGRFNGYAALAMDDEDENELSAADAELAEAEEEELKQEETKDEND